jgi:hypothetical protein
MTVIQQTYIFIGLDYYYCLFYFYKCSEKILKNPVFKSTIFFLDADVYLDMIYTNSDK